MPILFLLTLFSNYAFAQSSNEQQGGLAEFLPLIIVITIWYFFFYKPRKRKKDEKLKLRKFAQQVASERDESNNESYIRQGKKSRYCQSCNAPITDRNAVNCSYCGSIFPD